MPDINTYSISDIELKAFINDVFKKYGYDFSDYSEASLKRRITRILCNNSISNLQELRNEVLQSPQQLNMFIEEVTVNVTEMFRDPHFFNALKEKVFPELKKLDSIRIWHAGCSSGEEVYSLAILLKEEGLLEKSLLYATDINQSVLETAKKGTYSLEQIKEYSTAYINAGGKNALHNYYQTHHNNIKFNDDLTKRMVFSVHNLCIDQSFNEFNLIICRNVLIYFNRNLQDRVLNLFKDSIAENGFLALGTKETIEFSTVLDLFECTSNQLKIWRRKRQ